MREKLQELYNSHIGIPIVFEADVGFRRPGNVRFASKPSMQKLLLKVRQNGIPITDHLIMTVGKEIPAIPMVYSRIMPGMEIKFYGEIFPYTRRSDNTEDYGIKMTRLLESKQKNRNLLKEAWLNGQVSSHQYLEQMKRR